MKKKEIISAIENSNKKEISNCTFTGVKYDAKAVNAIEMIAEGLIENAKGLGKLAEVLKASNVHIETMIRVEADK